MRLWTSFHAFIAHVHVFFRSSRCVFGSIPGRLLQLLHLDEVADVPSEDAQLVGLVEGF